MSACSFVYALYEEGFPDAVRYVGRTTRGTKRIAEHHQCRGRGHCRRWIQSLRKGERGLCYRVLEYCPADELNMRERYWIARLRSEGHRLTNLTDGGDGCLGRPLSEASRKRLSTLARLRPPPTDAMRQRMREAHLGKRHDEATRAKLSVVQRGKKRTVETRKRLSASKFGHAVSAECRAKLAAANLGKTASEQTRRRMMESAARGERNPQARLNEEQIRTIRQRASLGERHRAIASDFGVSQVTISKVVRGVAWAHVK